MLEKQALADVLWLFKSLMSTFRIGGQMYHVCGHMDELLRNDQLSVEQMVNCQVDKLTAEALVRGSVSSEIHHKTVPC